MFIFFAAILISSDAITTAGLQEGREGEGRGVGELIIPFGNHVIPMQRGVFVFVQEEHNYVTSDCGPATSAVYSIKRPLPLPCAPSIAR